MKASRTARTRWRALMIPALAIAVAGCSDLTRSGDPVIKTHLTDDVVTLATKAERRLVFASTSENPRLRVCAEPSPDAIEALSAAFRAGIEASGSSGEVTDAKVQAELAQGLATSVGSLIRRSQGLQYLRDGTYALCQGAMSGIANARDPEETRRVIIGFYKMLLNKSADLIAAEIDHPNWHTKPEVKIVAPDLSAVPGEATSAAPAGAS